MSPILGNCSSGHLGVTPEFVDFVAAPQIKLSGARGAETGYNGYKLYRTNCLPSDSLGLENTRNLSDVGGRSAENTRNLSDSAVSSCPTVRQCYVQLSNGWTVLYPTVS